MSRLRRMLLGSLLCGVALATSGCFLRLVTTRVDVTTIGEEVRQVITAVFANATVTVCADLRATFSDTTVDCTYVFADEEGVATVTSTAELVHDFGLFGVIIDPVILQVPQDVVSVSGTFATPGESPRPLLITTVASFFAQPGTQIVPEAGQKFVIVDFPADALATLTTAGTAFDFTFQFTRSLPISPPPPPSMSIKAMFTGRIETRGQTFYPPLFPCVTSFAQVPALTLQVPGNLTSVLSQIVSLVRANATLACNNTAYDFTPATLFTEHFQCYKAKDSKGSICRDGAPRNEGAVCETERDCDGVEGETAFCVPKSFPKDLRVTLTDQFERGLFEVKKPLGLCNPADKNGGGINDRATHLKAYQIGLANRQCAPEATQNAGGACRNEQDCGGTGTTAPLCRIQPAHIRQTNVRIVDQFHTQDAPLRLDTIKPDRLLVPTAKSLLQPVDPPDPTTHEVDHFKCYKVKASRGAPKFQPIRNVSVVDQFNQPKVFDFKKPTRVCTPAAKNGEAIKHDAIHLMCYQVKAVKTTPPQPKHVKVKGIFVNNQFGPEQLDTISEDELCMPAFKNVPAP